MPKPCAARRCLLLALALAPMCLLAAAPRPVNQAARFAGVHRELDALVAAHAVPSIAAAAVERGRIVWIESRGWADVAARRRAAPDTVYRIGAVSASLTATAAAVAKADARVDLAQTLARYLPAYAADPRLGTQRLQDLLDGNAGLAQAVHYRGLPGDFGNLGTERFVAEYAVAALPTGGHDGSNMGAELAARAISAALQQPFAAILRERLLAPLHMAQTRCAAAATPPARLARPYRAELQPVPASYETDPPAGAGCVASLRDLAAYASFHLSTIPSGRAPLGAVALARLHTPRAGSHYANGWDNVGSGELAQLLSAGRVDGGRAVVLLAPAHRSGVVVLANADSDAVDRLAHAALEVLVPGSAAEFTAAAAKLQSDRERAAAAGHPPAGPWQMHGEVAVGGVAHVLDAEASPGGIGLRYDAGAAQHGEASGDPGSGNWEIACNDLLPACRQGRGAVARLRLAGAVDGYAGVITVESRLGTFPYAVRLSPLPR